VRADLLVGVVWISNFLLQGNEETSMDSPSRWIVFVFNPNEDLSSRGSLVSVGDDFLLIRLVRKGPPTRKCDDHKILCDHYPYAEPNVEEWTRGGGGNERMHKNSYLHFLIDAVTTETISCEC